MSKVLQLLQLARQQIGVAESPAGSNNVKYNTAYYGREVSGGNYSWCAVFVWWCMREIGCSDLYYDGAKTAYVPALLSWARSNRLTVKDPQPGDWILFDWEPNDSPNHIGIVEEVNSSTVTTIEGNSSDKVQRKTYNRDNKAIMAYVRPAWPTDQAEPDLNYITKEELRSMLQDLLDKLQ